MRLRLSITFLFFCSSSISLAQSCVETILPTTKFATYKASDNGIVMNQKIMWIRCTVGQTWHKGKCNGKAVLKSWDEAMDLAKNSTLHSHNDWRLPTVHELSELTELSCQNPAINVKLFPDTPSLSFWTSTEFINDKNNAWQVFFGSGENHTAKKSTAAAIRLVRTIGIDKN